MARGPKNTIPRACVIGWPVGHSRSPLIHGFWLDKLELAGAYDKQEISPEAFPDFVKTLAERGYVGANVTVPHKVAALDLADHVTEEARQIGAANTLWYEGKTLCATNTDSYGFLAHLSQSVPDWNAIDRPVAVLGAGGAARAVCHGLLTAGVPRILLFNRTRDKAEAIAARFGPRVIVREWGTWQTLAEVGLLVNSTSLGMTGKPPLSIDLTPMPDDAVVYDIVYVPLETPLLGAARKRGLKTVDGLGMLLHQAVPGFALWFGVRPEVTPDLRARIIADLEGNSC